MRREPILDQQHLRMDSRGIARNRQLASHINELSIEILENTFAESAAKVVIAVGVAATTSATDISTAGKALLNKSNVIAIYGSNEAAANGILDSTNEGADLKTKSIVAVGFDAGKRQKAAVASGLFLGSITQDPYNIGYLAVELAYKAYKGEKVADVDTGAKFYTKDNMNNPDIKDLVYD